MNRRDLREAVLAAIQRTRGSLHDPLFARLLTDSALDASFAALEFDSLAAMEFCLAVEDATGIEIDPGHLVLNPSVNALIDHLASHDPGR